VTGTHRAVDVPRAASDHGEFGWEARLVF